MFRIGPRRSVVRDIGTYMFRTGLPLPPRAPPRT